MTILDMILERELTPEQREAKRLRAKARREKRREETRSASPAPAPSRDDSHLDDVVRNREPDPDSSVEISSGFLRVQWRKYNEKYFGGELREPKFFMPKSGSGSMGVCSHDYDPRSNEIYCSAIRINEKLENYQTFRNVMVHEMVHQWAYQQLDEEDIRRANGYGMARSRKWWNALTSPMGRDGHHGTWLQKCEELTSKFPYLKLTKYGQRDELELEGEEKSAAVEAAKGNHIVLCEPGGGRHKYFYYLTDSGFQELKSEIEAGKRAGKWVEYEFDPEKLAKEKVTALTSAGKSAYKGSYLDDLIERGVVSKWNSKHLGGEKSTARRVRFSWF